MDEQKPKERVLYQKPEALDLGPVAPIIGASCVDGNIFPTACDPTGNGDEGSRRAPSSDGSRKDEFDPSDIFK